jgi:hypothetical protein
MAMGVFEVRGRSWLAAWCVAAAMLISGCVTYEDKRCAVDAINKEFRNDYEAILMKDGTRVFSVSRAEAYDAVRVSMARLGMRVEAQDPVLGYVNVYGPAPRPLDEQEWKKAAEADLPRVREIIGVPRSLKCRPALRFRSLRACARPRRRSRGSPAGNTCHPPRSEWR